MHWSCLRWLSLLLMSQVSITGNRIGKNGRLTKPNQSADIYRKGQDIPPALSCLDWKFCDSQQILHRLVYLAVLKAVEVDLGGFKVGMPETLADYGYVHSRPFQDGCKSMPCDISREIYL